MKRFDHDLTWQITIILYLFIICSFVHNADAKVPNTYTTVAEDIAYFTWAKHRFNMHIPKDDLLLKFYAYQYIENDLPLHIEINGNGIDYRSTEGHGEFTWHECKVPRSYFINGDNEIIFKSNSQTTNSWAIAIEHVDIPQGSSKSCNRGKSWYSRNLGYNFSVVGQYAVRLVDSSGKTLEMMPVTPVVEPVPRIVKTSQIEDLMDNSGSNLIKSATLTVVDKTENDIIEVRSGTTPKPQKLSWTPWKPIELHGSNSVIAPVRLRYLQWRIVRNGTGSGSEPEVLLSRNTLKVTPAKGQYRPYTVTRVFQGEDLFDCLRDHNIEMDHSKDGARLRYGEIIKDEDGNAQLNIDRTHFEDSDKLFTPWWMGEQVSDAVWIKKDLLVETPEMDKAYLMIYYELWTHSKRKGGYLYSESGSMVPLLVSINGIDLDPIAPDTGWRNRTVDWRLVEFPKNLIKSGLNEVIIHTGEGADWRFAYENSLTPNRSARSIDGGKTWNYNCLGENANDNGEYLIRFYFDRYHYEGLVWSQPIPLWGEKENDWLQKAKDITVEVAAEGNVPGTAKVIMEVRFGSDLIPDASSWTEWSQPSDGKSLHVTVPCEGLSYMQWRARLNTTSRVVTPVLTSVQVRIKGERRNTTDEKGVVIDELSNPELRLSSYEQQYDSVDNEMLKKLREWYPLDEVVKKGHTELDKLRLLAAWINEFRYSPPQLDSERYRSHVIGNRTTHWAPNNAVWSLDMFSRKYGHLNRRYGAHCHDYNIAFVGCCKALGYIARPLLMDRQFPSSGGHSFPEVWSNEFNKWIYLDPYRHQYYAYADSTPANTFELHEAQFDSLLFKRIFTIRLDRDLAPPKDRGRGIPPDVSEAPIGYHAFSIWKRFNLMDEPAPYPIWDGVNTFRWDGRIWYQDTRAMFYPEFTYNTNRPEDMYWGVNQCFIQPEYYGNGAVKVELSNNMPHFKCYEVRFNNGNSWKQYTGDFLWQLDSGKNSMEVRPVNLYGIPGSPNHLSITMKG